MKKTVICTTAFAFLFSLGMAGTSFAAADNMVLKGGSLGDVPFPHKLHQQTLHDCKLCHKMFPMKADAIQNAIASGKLKKKDVMNNCIDCHKADKAKGVKAGPTTCKECHSKK